MQRHEHLQFQLARSQEIKGSVSLYCSVTAAYSVLPNIFQRFRKVYPHVHLKLQTGDAADALARLQNRETDIAIAALPENLPDRINSLELTATPLVFIAPTEYPDTVHNNESQQINWLQTPFIMPTSGLSRRRVDQWFVEKKIRPNVYAEVAGNEAIIAMVSLGCGIGVVPLLVLEQSPAKEQVTILDVTPGLAPFTIAVCTMRKKNCSPQVQAFWELAQQT